MRNFTRLLLAATLVALGVWLWMILFPSPEKVIRKRLSAVARTASFASDEGNLPRLANVARLVSYFSPDIEVKIDELGSGQHTLSGREEITQAVMAVRSAVASLSVQFLDANVTVAPDQQSAVVDLTDRAGIPSDKNFFVQEMKFSLKKMDGEWLITQIETVKTLS